MNASPTTNRTSQIDNRFHAGATYRVRDPLYILLQRQQEDAIAKIRDINEFRESFFSNLNNYTRSAYMALSTDQTSTVQLLL